MDGGWEIYPPASLPLPEPGPDAIATAYTEADARLIAAAPELLEACKLALYFVEASGNPEGHTATELRSAFAKATK